MFEFSANSYRRLIGAISDGGYRTIRFGEVQSEANRNGKTWLLRHDVDVSMDFAYEMGQVERELGVRATYFVMLRSPMYNLMSFHSLKVLGALQQLGHEIGLHFDANELAPGETARARLATDMDILARLIGHPIGAFSFHQPSRAIIDERIDLPGVINTYHPTHLAGYKYLSDSNRIWRDVDPFQVVSAGEPRVHLLTHPVWWFAQGSGTEDCWDEAIQVNFDRTQGQLVARERAYGPPREMLLRRKSQR
jgi:hypothetical protein